MMELQVNVGELYCNGNSLQEKEGQGCNFEEYQILQSRSMEKKNQELRKKKRGNNGGDIGT
jgi:hypothetical protein